MLPEKKEKKYTAEATDCNSKKPNLECMEKGEDRFLNIKKEFSPCEPHYVLCLVRP
jgi:hypothetical protein